MDAPSGTSTRESAAALTIVALILMSVMVPPETRTSALYGKGFVTAVPVAGSVGAVCTPVPVAVAGVSPVWIAAVALPLSTGWPVIEQVRFEFVSRKMPFAPLLL